MAKKTRRAAKAAKAVPFNAADVANIARSNPYIQRMVEDADLRENVRTALDSSKSAYSRISNGKAPHKAVMNDKKLQRDLRNAFEAARDAFESLQAPKRRARKRRFSSLFMIIIVSGIAALVASEGLRSKLLDTLFGAEEEFQYTPPASTGAATTPGAPVSAA